MSDLDNIAGYESAKEKLARTADILAHPNAYRLHGIRVPRALLLYGRPGIEKTLMTRFLIAESGRAVFTCRANTPGKQFVAAIKDAFAQAAEHAPSIVFLEDIDAFAKKSDRRRETPEYAAVQACIDNLGDADVFVFATATNVRRLPAPLLQPGRLDDRAEVARPREAEAQQNADLYLAHAFPAPGFREPATPWRVWTGFGWRTNHAVMSKYKGRHTNMRMTVEALAKCIETINATPCCFITAFKPESSPSENRRRNRELEADLRDSGLTYYRVYGRCAERAEASRETPTIEKAFMISNTVFPEQRFITLCTSWCEKHDLDAVLVTLPPSRYAKRCRTVGRCYDRRGSVRSAFEDVHPSDVEQHFAEIFKRRFTMVASSVAFRSTACWTDTLNGLRRGDARFKHLYPDLCNQRTADTGHEPETDGRGEAPRASRRSPWLESRSEFGEDIGYPIVDRIDETLCNPLIRAYVPPAIYLTAGTPDTAPRIRFDGGCADTSDYHHSPEYVCRIPGSWSIETDEWATPSTCPNAYDKAVSDRLARLVGAVEPVVLLHWFCRIDDDVAAEYLKGLCDLSDVVASLCAPSSIETMEQLHAYCEQHRLYRFGPDERLRPLRA